MRKFLIFGCGQIRDGILYSFAFFAAGVAMMLAGLQLIPNVANINHVFTVIGMLLFFFAPIILVSTFLLTILSNVDDGCE
ncbi:hypothetical protein [Solemya velum gill symbiont]|uniref:Uncharacterized protein n=1 Tax=Solemya velum gill symbiont TaxID=2340 RepID=A0A0B0H6S0_SOVGS|nr:hypothetical protein [Solemya velum gill symbiont]KHF24805.1 hypothetical protein JV46_03310 [Solemya velum gill symbiont]OOY33929.1 hypothetical protein BOV88_12610 [Solemya velum gill symbiont]OOY36583.1 hypothetical protein BOV89_11750 [Solemya velum gill symbiont]OOY39211.1 hypothetical protein BOV90_10595 [Solemya velum gill symbiont]OOY43946.1 hypothetical protein BOV91_02650 [Solemya velum gill symbiont]